MSLIADSLKKAVKEKTAPKWETEINPVGRRETVKRPGLSNVFRILLLIVLPTGILAYLISIGAFSLKKASITQRPDLPVSVPVEKARVTPASKPAPEVPLEKSVAVSPAKPTKKASVEKATVALKTSDKSFASKKEKTGVKKVAPSGSPRKESREPKKAIISIPVIPDEKAVALSVPDLQSTKPVAAKIPLIATVETPLLKSSEVEIPDNEIATAPSAKPSVNPVLEKPQAPPVQKIPAPVVAEKKIPASPLAPSTQKPKAEVAPLEAPLLKSSDVEISDDEIVTGPAPSVKPSVNPVLEKPQAPPEQKIPAPVVTEKKIPASPLAQSTEKPKAEVAPVETPMLKSSEAEISDAVKENSEKLAIEVQKKNPEVASLPPSPPPSTAKPEIFRVDPKGQENVFNSSDYFFNRGIFFQQARDWQKALVNYSKSEELDPNNPDTYNNKGVVLKEMGKYDKALDEFLRAVFLDSGYAKAYNNIGVVYYMQKNYPEAIRHYLKAIDINPTNLEAFNNLAIIYKKQKELDKARGVLNRALALDPDHPGTNYNLAVLYEENSEIKPALHFYRRFIELGAINYPSLVTQVKEHLAGMGSQ